MQLLRSILSLLLCVGAACSCLAQQPSADIAASLAPALDPPCIAGTAHTVGSVHTPLPEQYIWTANDAAVATHQGPLSNLKRNDWKVEPHFFRATFAIASPPSTATLYIAGPRSARVWINGHPAAQLEFAPGHHFGFGVLSARVGAFLRTGPNTIAIEAVRGYGSHHHTNALLTSWLNSGEVLAVKILPAAAGVNAPALLISNATWESAIHSTPGWQQPAFNDSAWKPVTSLGGIESSVDFFQWNADAGLYDWPGYLGEAPFMASCRLHPITTTQRTDGLLVDFGREFNGRVVVAAGAHTLHAHIRYGESMGELLHAPYFGDVPLTVPAGSEARVPKSGLRYALVSFDGDNSGARVSAEAIYNPLTPVGYFDSSDAQLNRIWQTAAYTAHLAVQDSILDGIKRDRGRWIGDDEVINRVVGDVYGDPRLIAAGLDDAIGPAPVTEHVNGLPGYSAWWVIAESEYVRRFGDMRQLQAVKACMLQLLPRMERELNAQSLYTAASGAKPFVDWAPGLSGDSPEARRAVHFEYLLAFRRAAWLLRLAGDEPDAAHYAARADAMTAAAQQFLRDPSGAYGDRWQTNAIAVLAGAVTTPAQREAVWRVLARTVTTRKPGDIITPYYGSYLLSAMAELGHRREALDWLRAYWGGMLRNGATTFWEAWDPAWAGPDPHAHLQADGKVGYNASLCHGWSSGPAAWLMEELLGVTPLTPGYSEAQIRPDLAGLASIHGAVATPHGPIRVSVTGRSIAVGLPSGVSASILLPAGTWLLNGASIKTQPAESGARRLVIVRRAGNFEFVRQP